MSKASLIIVVLTFCCSALLSVNPVFSQYERKATGNLLIFKAFNEESADTFSLVGTYRDFNLREFVPVDSIEVKSRKKDFVGVWAGSDPNTWYLTYGSKKYLRGWKVTKAADHYLLTNYPGRERYVGIDSIIITPSLLLKRHQIVTSGVPGPHVDELEVFEMPDSASFRLYKTNEDNDGLYRQFAMLSRKDSTSTLVRSLKDQPLYKVIRCDRMECVGRDIMFYYLRKKWMFDNLEWSQSNQYFRLE